MIIEKKKLCTKCGLIKQLTEVNWYKARPTASHPKGGWQSHCRECWKIVNSSNKQRRKSNSPSDVKVSAVNRRTRDSITLLRETPDSG